MDVISGAQRAYLAVFTYAYFAVFIYAEISYTIYISLKYSASEKNNSTEEANISKDPCFIGMERKSVFPR